MQTMDDVHSLEHSALYFSMFNSHCSAQEADNVGRSQCLLFQLTNSSMKHLETKVKNSKATGNMTSSTRL